MSDNQVTLIGNLTRDPELRFTTGGIAACGFGLAISKRYKNDDNEWVDGETSFFNCTAWRDLGENIAKSAGKGQRWIVIGELRQRSWEDDDGNKRSAIDVQVSAAGPDMKWATCEIERTERKSGNQATAANAPRNRQQNREPDPIYGDEEPF